MTHWRLTGSVYFATWQLKKAQRELTSNERDVIVSALKYFDAKHYDLIGYVVMDDHVHVLVTPFDNYPLEKIVHSWKSYTAHKLQRESGRQGKIWQEEYFDHIIRDENEFLEKAQYILTNPLKTWPEIEEYEWVWIKMES